MMTDMFWTARNVVVGTAAITLALGTTSACSGHGNTSSCGPDLYKFDVSGGASSTVSSCAGNLPEQPITIVVTAGKTIEATIIAAPGYPVPMPTNGRVLKLVRHTDTAATYTALVGGTTNLTVTSQYCPASDTTGMPTCPVAVVTVRI